MNTSHHLQLRKDLQKQVLLTHVSHIVQVNQKKLRRHYLLQNLLQKLVLIIYAGHMIIQKRLRKHLLIKKIIIDVNHINLLYLILIITNQKL